jgi:hypothetical protein
LIPRLKIDGASRHTSTPGIAPQASEPTLINLWLASG